MRRRNPTKDAVMTSGPDAPGSPSVPRHVPAGTTGTGGASAAAAATDVSVDSDGGARKGDVVLKSVTFYLDADMGDGDLTDIASYALLANGDGKKTMVVAEDTATQDRYLKIEKKVCDLAVAGLRARGVL